MKKEFERTEPEKVGVPSGALLRFLEKTETLPTEMHGFMLMRHGKVCAEGWWAPYGSETLHGSNSFGKTYTGTAVGVAYTEGLLGLDERLTDIFPEYAHLIRDERMKRVRVRDMLSMSAGITDEVFGATDSVEQYMTRVPTHEPGTFFCYNNSTASVLGAAVQKRTGRSLMDYLDEKVFSKIGIESRNFCWVEESGTELNAAAGGILSTTEQNLRLMKLYADGGLCGGERLLAEDFVKEAISPHHIADMDDGTDYRADDIRYGWMMWRAEKHGAYFGWGALGQIVMVMPEKDLILSLHQRSAREADIEALRAFWELVVPELDTCAPDDGADFRRLRDKLASLTLPEMTGPALPLSGADADGKDFLPDAGLRFENETFAMMTKAPHEPDLEGFRFVFREAETVLLYAAGGRERRLIAGMDGRGRFNTLPTLDGYAQTVYASGAWKEEGVFDLCLRFMGFSNKKTYRFDFRPGRACVDMFRYNGNTMDAQSALRIPFRRTGKE